jgi:threonylcarbamoyladenosine tRNA methylthiotransferase MtaB
MTESPHLLTFGCRLNSYESEAMRRLASEAGLTDVVIVNTCSVTAEAVRQAGQAIRKARRERPQATIIVAGCAAQVEPERFADMPEVDFVIGNEGKLKIETYLNLMSPSREGENPEPLIEAHNLNGHSREGGNPGPFVESASASSKRLGENEKAKNLVHPIDSVQDVDAPLVHGYEGLARAFVQIQNGCDNRCTFCIIPYGRGPSRSVTPDRVVEQVRLLVAKEGYNEIVFTGVDISSYGRDLGNDWRLGKLIKQVLREVPSLPRLRLSSLDPAAIDEDLWDVLATDPRLMPHWHLSLQAGDDMILKRMKRRHNPADIVALVQRARQLRPDIVFGADIIAGFPTETDEMAANTLNLVRECDLTWLHVFTYSARKRTPASRMPQVHGSLRQFRAAALREAGEQAAQKHYAFLIGQKIPVLVEQKGLGCSPTFAKMAIPDDLPVGAVVQVVGRSVQAGKLTASAL